MDQETWNDVVDAADTVLVLEPAATQPVFTIRLEALQLAALKAIIDDALRMGTARAVLMSDGRPFECVVECAP